EPDTSAPGWAGGASAPGFFWAARTGLADDSAASFPSCAFSATRPPLVPNTRATVNNASEANFSLVQNMACNTPSVRAATLAEIAPAVAAVGSAANTSAALVVAIISTLGAADTAFAASRVASNPLEQATPWRDRRLARMIRA